MKQKPPHIFIENAKLEFAGETLFSNLNCNLPAGEFTCLLGPSGVGKTTLLQCIAGLIKNTKTTHLNYNLRASDNKPVHDRVAYMAQNDLLMPWLKILDNVLIGTRLRGDKTSKEKIAYATQLLNQVGLTKAINKYPYELSGGMRQRVALVRTLMEDKPIILMDEPFAALDTITRIKLQELTAELLHGSTVLLVTHNPLEALRLGHRIYVMSGQPAIMDKPLIPDGTPPRALGDPELIILEAELLKRLTKAQELMA